MAEQAQVRGNYIREPCTTLSCWSSGTELAGVECGCLSLWWQRWLECLTPSTDCRHSPSRTRKMGRERDRTRIRTDEPALWQLIFPVGRKIFRTGRFYKTYWPLVYLAPANWKLIKQKQDIKSAIQFDCPLWKLFLNSYICNLDISSRLDVALFISILIETFFSVPKLDWSRESGLYKWRPIGEGCKFSRSASCRH